MRQRIGERISCMRSGTRIVAMTGEKMAAMEQCESAENGRNRRDGIPMDSRGAHEGTPGKAFPGTPGRHPRWELRRIPVRIRLQRALRDPLWIMKTCILLACPAVLALWERRHRRQRMGKEERPCPWEQVHTDAGEPEEVVSAEEEGAAEAAKARDGRKGGRQSGRGKRG